MSERAQIQRASRLHARFAIPRDGFDKVVRRSHRNWIILLYGLILAGICTYVVANVRGLVILWDETEAEAFLRFLFYPSAAWAAAGILLLSYRTVLWIRYRPFPPADFEEAPSLSVIVPAFNEGAMVLKSLESVLAARYPEERLELVVVDDGSTDDTWEYIDRVAQDHPGRVTAVRFPKNRGKREALACGFAQARGELLVTLDSDSVIEPDALLALAGPFRDPTVGAVAGKVIVYNREEGIIPRMLHVRFLLTFDVSRAVESSYGTVYCCPGALTAYRAAALTHILPRWKNQRFLGARCVTGEDRALTNDLLDKGFNTVYQSAAVVMTVVPVRYQKLCRMFLRWDRSYVREELRFLRIVWKRPWYARWIAFLDRLVTNLHFPIGYGALVLVAADTIANPPFALQFLGAMGFFLLLSTLYCLRSERTLRGLFYGVLFGYFSAFAMSWIMPYAFFTVRSRSWLTRTAKPKSVSLRRAAATPCTNPVV